jgi:anti-sigma factor RsiW
MRLRRRHHRDPDALVCREFVELVTDYLEGMLPPSEQARFEAHLTDCDGCPGYLEDMRRMINSMSDLPEPPVDPATHKALLRAFRDLRPQ